MRVVLKRTAADDGHFDIISETGSSSESNAKCFLGDSVIAWSMQTDYWQLV